MSFDRVILVGACALLATACSTPEPNTVQIDPGMGEAVSWNKEAHIINPDPVYPADALPAGANGERSADAMERYRKGQVKDLERVETTESSGSGGRGPQ